MEENTNSIKENANVIAIENKVVATIVDIKQFPDDEKRVSLVFDKEMDCIDKDGKLVKNTSITKTKSSLLKAAAASDELANVVFCELETPSLGLIKLLCIGAKCTLERTFVAKDELTQNGNKMEKDTIVTHIAKIETQKHSALIEKRIVQKLDKEVEETEKAAKEEKKSIFDD